jgi:alpha-ketoglutarate-dependent 2,4-dichlorophenoxyacetate dioxygenase
MSASTPELDLEPLHPSFGARVTGIDLASPMSSATHDAVMAAFNDYSVLVFPGQSLDDETQVSFSATFGPLEKAITRKAASGAGLHVADLTNIDADGNLIPPDDRKQLFHKANHLWHTDSTYKPQTALASMLYAIVVPSRGGETEYVSTRAAFEALPPARQQELMGQWALHDFQRSRDLVAPGLVEKNVQNSLPPVWRPLVRLNPSTGRPALYIASHAVQIEGMSREDSRPVLDELLDFCTRGECIYTHSWQPGDLVMWDNRCTMHRGRPWDAHNEQRTMARTTVIDTGYDDEPQVRARAA